MATTRPVYLSATIGAMVEATWTGYVGKVDIRREELQLYVPKIPTYRGGFYQKLQEFVRACEHMYETRPIKYRSVKGRVMLAKGNLQESFHANHPTLLVDWIYVAAGSKAICQLQNACYAIRKQDKVISLPFMTIKDTFHSIDIIDGTFLANVILRRCYLIHLIQHRQSAKFGFFICCSIWKRGNSLMEHFYPHFETLKIFLTNSNDFESS